MLSTVSLQQRRTAYTLSQQSWWPTLRELLDAELVLVYELLTDAPSPVALHQLQGRAKATKEFLELIHTARDILAKD